MILKPISFWQAGTAPTGLPEGWTPADLFGSGEQGAWYDISDLSTLWQDVDGTVAVTATGQSVARIDDKSGNANHALQATAANRPTLQQDGSSLYYLSCDGTNDWLRCDYGATLTALTRAMAFNVAGADIVCDDADTANRGSLYSSADGSLRWAVQGTTGSMFTAVGGWTRSANLVAVGSVDSGRNYALTGSGTAISGTSTLALADANGVTLGGAASGALPIQGRIYGFIDVSRVVSALERGGIEDYLASKCGVTL